MRRRTDSAGSRRASSTRALAAGYWRILAPEYREQLAEWLAAQGGTLEDRTIQLKGIDVPVHAKRWTVFPG